MTVETFKKSRKIAFAIFRHKHPHDRLSEDRLDDLHSRAWLVLLQWQRRNHISKWIPATLLARAMHLLYIKDWKRKKKVREWHNVFLARLDSERYRRNVVNGLLDGAEPDVRQVMELRLQGYTKEEIAKTLGTSESTVARRIAAFTELARAA